MQKKMFYLLCVLWFGLLAASSASAQWIPMIAKHRHFHYDVLPDGSQTLTEEVQGTFSRASNGSSLLKLQNYKNGLLVGERETVLKDAGTGKIYSIYYGRQYAIIRQQLPVPIQPMNYRIDPNAPQSTVNGIACTEIVSNRPMYSGKSCVSNIYDLVVKADIVLSGKKHNYRDIIEYYDFQFVEPDPSLFVLPTGLRIVPNQTAQSVAK